MAGVVSALQQNFSFSRKTWRALLFIIMQPSRLLQEQLGGRFDYTLLRTDLETMRKRTHTSFLV